MAFDAFLKIEGIDGESLDSKHPGEIEVESFSWGMTNVGSGGTGSGGGTGKVSVQDFHFTAQTSKASPNLMLACATGVHIKKAVLAVRKAGAGGFEYLKVTLEDCLVSSFVPVGRVGEGDRPTEEMSLNFVKIDWKYTVQRTGETVETSFDQRGLNIG